MTLDPDFAMNNYVKLYYTTNAKPIHNRVIRVMADGDHAVDFWTFRATHLGEFNGLAPTGRRVEFNGIDVVKVRDGRIAEIWHVEDMARMLDQLGVTDRLPRVQSRIEERQ